MGTSTRGRRLLRTAVALGIAAVSCPVGASLAAAAPAPTGWQGVVSHGSRAPVPAGWQAVNFHGYRATVPAGWPVIDLTRQPAACVRYDRPAVYLGHPGTRQDCPAHLVGRTDTLLVEP